MPTGFIEAADQRVREAPDSHIPPHARGDPRPPGDRVREPVGIGQHAALVRQRHPAGGHHATDDTTVPSDWVNASVNVNLDGTGVQGFEWKIDCGTTQIGPTATITGTGTHSFLHRAQETSTGHWTGWDEDFVYVDATPPVDTSTVPADWQHDKATITLSGTDTGDQSGVARMVYELDDNGPTAASVGDSFDICLLYTSPSPRD